MSGHLESESPSPGAGGGGAESTVPEVGVQQDRVPDAALTLESLAAALRSGVRRRRRHLERWPRHIRWTFARDQARLPR